MKKTCNERVQSRKKLEERKYDLRMMGLDVMDYFGSEQFKKEWEAMTPKQRIRLCIKMCVYGFYLAVNYRPGEELQTLLAPEAIKLRKKLLAYAQSIILRNEKRRAKQAQKKMSVHPGEIG